MAKVIIKCDWCGSEMQRFPSRIKHHNFCSKKCLANYSNRTVNPNGYTNLKEYANISANMSKLNAEMNAIRMTTEVKEKLRNARLHTGSGKSYEKTYGRHTHRIVAERMLGRPLRQGEVVHHINGNKRDNRECNLMVFSSQAEHAKFHTEKGVIG